MSRPLLQKKHFEAIAEIIRDNRAIIELDDKVLSGMEFASRVLAEDLARYFTSENPQFKTARFLETCGISED